MLPGLYSSAAGMLGRLEQQDIIANNLANVNTAGFKRTAVGFLGFDRALQGAAQATGSSYVLPQLVVQEDARQGSVQDTDVPTNLALDGPGFFVVQTEAGERLVRGGNFRLDSTGRLMTSDGSPVLGERGSIQVGAGKWSVDADGNIRSGQTLIDRLRIEKGPNDGSVRVVSGSLEGSNVSAVEEMVSMIAAMRAYEACQKTIQALDQTLDKAINQMGRTG